MTAELDKKEWQEKFEILKQEQSHSNETLR